MGKAADSGFAAWLRLGLVAAAAAAVLCVLSLAACGADGDAATDAVQAGDAEAGPGGSGAPVPRAADSGSSLVSAGGDAGGTEPPAAEDPVAD